MNEEQLGYFQYLLNDKPLPSRSTSNWNLERLVLVEGVKEKALKQTQELTTNFTLNPQVYKSGI